MNPDIRIDVEFIGHHKTIKLRRRLGADGVLSLICLWTWAARNRPDGDLSGMDAEDIEIVSQWCGVVRSYYDVLYDVGFVDVERNESGEITSIRLHNWARRNPWASEAGNRSDSARLSRLARENPEKAKELKDMGASGISHQEYQKYKRSTTVLRNSTNRSTPAPAPDPAPKSKASQHRIAGTHYGVSRGVGS